MAEINPAYVIGQASNTARMFRQTLGSIYGNTQGVLTPTDLAVTGTTGTLTVTVAAGSAVVSGSHATYQGSYLVTNDAAKSVPLTTAPATVGYSRIDRIVARIKDRDYSDATDAWSLEVITGNAGASPTAPALLSSCLELAQVTVSQAAGGIASGGIVDKRIVVSPTSGPTITTTSLLANNAATAGTEGQMVYDTTADQLLVNHGGTTPAWRAPWNLPWGILSIVSMSAGSQTGITTTATDINIGVAMATTASFLANRRYRVVAFLPEIASSVGSDVVELRILGGLTTATTSYGRSLHLMAGAGVSTSGRCEVYINPTSNAGTWAWKAQATRVSGSGTITLNVAALVSASYMYVEDIGPSAGPA